MKTGKFKILFVNIIIEVILITHRLLFIHGTSGQTTTITGKLESLLGFHFFLDKFSKRVSRALKPKWFRLVA